MNCHIFINQADLVVCLQIEQNDHVIGDELLELAENEVPPEDVVFHRFYMNKTGPIRSKAKKASSVLDEDTGELLADDASDGTDDEMQDLGEGLAEDGDYDYEDLDSDAFEDQDLLRDDSDVELGSISDDSAAEDGVMQNNDDDYAFLEGVGDSDGDLSDEEMVDVSNGGHGGSDAEEKRKRKHGASLFASLEDYEHLLDRDSNKAAPKQKHKANGEKKPKSKLQKKRAKTSG
jgi:ribosome biogenesis protein MAK21